MTNFEKQNPVGIPYLFLPLTEEEINQTIAMQDFMKKYNRDLPAMTVKAMMHYAGVQLRDIMEIWKKDTMRQVTENNPSQIITEKQKEEILNIQYTQFIAFLLANKERLPYSYDILQSVTMLLLQLYPPPDKETK